MSFLSYCLRAITVLALVESFRPDFIKTSISPSSRGRRITKSDLATRNTRLHAFLDTIKQRFQQNFKVPVEKKSESEQMIEFLDEKPWRAPKVKNLTYVYRPWKDSYLERNRKEDDDNIYLYAIPGGDKRFSFDKTRVDDLWEWPWLWSKTKTERLSWIHKLFYEDVDAVTVQEHMEMDVFYAEYDMVYRWGTMRIFEMTTFNIIALNLVYFTEFNGIKPTDLGLRPDGSLKPCPVQFHTCISSSNQPSDTDHYAPPLQWSRSKSPEQAYDEVKQAYLTYPKRGIKYTSGWIDRGGWKPQSFGGKYFYSQSESLTWNFREDTELLVDLDQRQVYYRSSARLGQVDWDVERSRYNQFVKMLTAKGGWDIKPMEKVHYVSKSPLRWTRLLLDKGAVAVERVTDEVLASVAGLGSGEGGAGGAGGDGVGMEVLGAAQRAVGDLSAAVKPLLTPIQTEVERLAGMIGEDKRGGEVIRGIVGFTVEAQRVVGEVERGAEEVWEQINRGTDSDDNSGPSSDSGSSGGAVEGGSVVGDGVRPLMGISKGADDDALLRAYSTSTTGDYEGTTIGSGGVGTSTSDSASSDGMPAASVSGGVDSWRIPRNGDISSVAGTKSEIDTNADYMDSRASSQQRDTSSRDIVGGVADDDQEVEVNDVEWLMDSMDEFSEPASASRPRGSLGMTDAGTRPSAGQRAGSSVGAVRRNRRQEPLVFDELDRKVMKGQLDELRTKFGLYGSEPSGVGDSEVKQRLIDKFKR